MVFKAQLIDMEKDEFEIRLLFVSRNRLYLSETIFGDLAWEWQFSLLTYLIHTYLLSVPCTVSSAVTRNTSSPLGTIFPLNEEV